MKIRPFRGFLVSAAAWIVLAACAPGNKLYVPGNIDRPPAAGPSAKGTPVAAVADFSYAASPDAPGVIGRDYDQVRQIVWEGDPGKTMADLVAAALAEHGVPTVRVRGGAPAPVTVPYWITGTVRRFAMDVRRGGALTVLTEATVTVAVTASGPAVSAPWETSVTSGTTLQDLIPLPEDLRKALQSAANGAAEEAASRLRERGVAAGPAGAGMGGNGTTR